MQVCIDLNSTRYHFRLLYYLTFCLSYLYIISLWLQRLCKLLQSWRATIISGFQSLDYGRQKRIRKPCQRSKMERFVKLISSWKTLIIFAKHYILDVWQNPEYASGSERDWTSETHKDFIVRFLNSYIDLVIWCLW